MTANQCKAVTDIKERHVSKKELIKILKVLNIINNAPDAVSVGKHTDGLMMSSYAYKAMVNINKILKHVIGR